MTDLRPLQSLLDQIAALDEDRDHPELARLWNAVRTYHEDASEEADTLAWHHECRAASPGPIWSTERNFDARARP